MKYIVLVDDADYNWLNKWNWSVVIWNHTKYATRVEDGRQILMHRLILDIMDLPIDVDHKDHNGLNNQRTNLRLCTKSLNAKNKRGRGASQYLGVSVHSPNGRIKKYKTKKGIKEYRLKGGAKYIAHIKLKNKYKHLGLYPFTPEGEIEAARAYDRAAKDIHGQFSNLNFPELC